MNFIPQSRDKSEFYFFGAGRKLSTTSIIFCLLKMSRKFSVTKLSKPSLQTIMASMAAERGLNSNIVFDKLVAEHSCKSVKDQTTDCCISVEMFGFETGIGLYQRLSGAETSVKNTMSESPPGKKMFKKDADYTGDKDDMMVTWATFQEICQLAQTDTGKSIRIYFACCSSALCVFLKRRAEYEEQKLKRLIQAAADKKADPREDELQEKNAALEAELQEEKAKTAALEGEIQESRDMIRELQQKLDQHVEQLHALQTQLRTELLPVLANHMAGLTSLGPALTNLTKALGSQ